MQSTQTLAYDKTAHSKLAWAIVITAAFYFFYEFIQMNLFNPINDQIKQAFDLNATQIGWLGSMYFIANSIFLFPAGILLDRYSTRNLLLVAVTFCTVGTFTFGMASTFTVAAIGRFAVGIGASFCFLSCIRLASRWFPPSRMAFVTGVIVTMAMLGGLVAQTPLAILSNAVGWRNAVLINAAIGIFVAIAILLIVQDRPPNSQATEASDKAHLKKLGLWRSIYLVLINPQNWFGGLYTSFMNLPVFLLGAIWGIPYLQQVHHLSQVEASYATTLFFLGVIFGSLVYGWLSDRMGRRVFPMTLGAILSLGAILALMYIPNLSLTSLILIFFLIGFLTSSQVLSYPTIAELNPTYLTSTAVSIDSVTIMTSGVICQPLFGWLLELGWDGQVVNGASVYSAQNFNIALLMMPISIVLALIISFFIKETYCKQQA